MKNIVSKDGKAAGMVVADIAKLHRVPVKQIEEQIRKGVKIEMEHTNDEREAEVIAMDHLVEIPDYYDRLIKMEKEASIEDAKMKDSAQDDKKYLRYLLRKEKVCPLDKYEMYELQELIQKYGNPSRRREDENVKFYDSLERLDKTKYHLEGDRVAHEEKLNLWGKDSESLPAAEKMYVAIHHSEPSDVNIFVGWSAKDIRKYFADPDAIESLPASQPILVISNDDEHIVTYVIGSSLDAFREKAIRIINKEIKAMLAGETTSYIEDVDDYYDDEGRMSISISVPSTGDSVHLWGIFDPESENPGQEVYDSWTTAIRNIEVDGDSTSQNNIVNLAARAHIMGTGTVIFYDRADLEEFKAEFEE